MTSYWLMYCVMLMVLGGYHPAYIDVPGEPKMSYYAPGDLNLAFLHQLSIATPGAEICGGRSRPASIEFTEILRYMVDSVNNRSDLLPNITLGLVMLDTCDRGGIAQSLRFLPVMDDNGTEAAGDGKDNLRRQYDVSAVLGLGNSEIALMTANLLSLFHIPNMGIWATSDELSDKKIYEYFVRLLPPDRFQIEAIVAFLNYHNWTYISVLYGEGAYGEHGAKQLEAVIRQTHTHICIGYSAMIHLDTTLDDSGRIIKNLLETAAKVVIMIARRDSVLTILDHPDMAGQHGKFIYIASDALMRYNFGPIYDGSFSVAFPAKQLPWVVDVINTRTPMTSKTNPWFMEVWQNERNCSYTSPSYINCSLIEDEPLNPRGFHRLVGTMVDAANIYFLALDSLLRARCPEVFNSPHLAKQCVRGEELLMHIKNTTFPGTAWDIRFDDAGDVEGSYIIQQYHSTRAQKRTPVALWSKLTEDIIVYPNVTDWSSFKSENSHQMDANADTPGALDVPAPAAVCSHPCGPRFYKLQRETQCCWDCIECRNNEITNDAKDGCLACPELMWPDEDTGTVCVPTKPRYFHLSSTLPVIIMLVSSIVFCVTVVVILLYVRNKQLTVVKSSDSVGVSDSILDIIILAGILLATVVSYVLMLKPSTWSCNIGIYGLMLSFAVIYCPSLVTINQLYRKWKAEKRSLDGITDTTGTSKTSTILLTAALILGQVLLIVITALASGPEASLRMHTPGSHEVELYCKTSLTLFLTCLGYDLLVLLACVIHALLTRSRAKNFNESWSIFLSVFFATILWIVVLPMYFTAHYAHHQMALLSFCLLANGACILLCWFVPKLYAVFYGESPKLIVPLKDIGSSGRSIL